MTATALAAILQPPTQSSAQPTAAIGGATPVVSSGGTGELPDTGLFDEMGAGGVGMFFAMAFGLLGVIFLSRRIRANIE